MDDRPLTDTTDVLPVLQAPTAYVCPGEDHPIPRSIHLARLAAYYPKCRECEHRQDTGQLPRSTVGRLEQTAARVIQPSPFGPEGVRGAYLNHITRQIAGRIAGAVADYCWQSQPLIGSALSLDEDLEDVPVPAEQGGPIIVLGHDGRPASPDLCVGVSGSLRRMGCEVIDVGRVSAPCHAFAVEHLQADAGLFVSGSGCPGQWTGLDLVGPRGVPWSMGADAGKPIGTLADIERRYMVGVSRPTRQGGAQRYFDAAVPYRASLLKHFRDLRPLRVVLGAADDVVLQTLRSLFDPLPCDLITMSGPLPAGDAPSSSDPVTRAFRAAIKEADAACGIAVAEDGQSVCCFDERGRPVQAAELFASVINDHRGARRLKVCVLDDCALKNAESLYESMRPRVSSAELIQSGREALARRLFEPTAGFGLEAGGRLWMKDGVPVCDAVLTIGLLLRTLSRHREPLSVQLSQN